MYAEKVNEGKATQKVLYRLSWDLKELETLLSNGKQLMVNVVAAVEKLDDDEVDVISENVAASLANMKVELSGFIKFLSKHQRKAATHIWVVMISPEDRRSKPYALPVQCIPYRNITAAKGRQIIDSLLKEMKARDMSVAGEFIIEV